MSSYPRAVWTVSQSQSQTIQSPVQKKFGRPVGFFAPTNKSRYHQQAVLNRNPRDERLVEPFEAAWERNLQFGTTGNIRMGLDLRDAGIEDILRGRIRPQQ